LLGNFLFPLLCFWRIVFPLQESSCCVFRVMVRLWKWSGCQVIGVMGEHEVFSEWWHNNEHETSLEWWWWWESIRRWSALHNNGRTWGEAMATWLWRVANVVFKMLSN
jgi:hypothetical protein